MSLSGYKITVIIYYSALIIWAVLSLWGYVPFLEGGGRENRYTFLASLFIEALSLMVLVISRNALKMRGVGTIVILWLLYTIPTVISTSNSLFIELTTVFWWPAIYILTCFVFRSKYSAYGFKMFRDFFVPVTFVLNTALFLYLRFRFSFADLLFVSNQVFYVSLLLPSLFLLKKRSMKYIGILIVVLCAAISFKRSTLIITLLTLLFSIFFEIKKKGSPFKRMATIGLVAGASIYLFIFVNNQTGGFIIERLEAMEETGGSGRIDIISTVTEHYSTSSTFDRFFGRGFNAVVKNNWNINEKDVSLSAHNDFLEILIDFGICGLVIYLLFVFRVLNNAFKTKAHNKLFQSNIVLLIVFFVMSSVSHLVLYPSYFAYLVMVIALTEISLENKNTLIEVEEQ